ncbi:MAG: response regulator [Acidobacteriota bacterium]
MAAPPIRILMIEDNHADAQLIERELRRARLAFSTVRVDTEKDFREALESSDPHVILGDYNLPRFDGITALKVATSLVPDTPFIFVSGSMEGESAVQALREGAVDYILKEQPSRLAASITRALEQRGERQLRRRAQEELQRSVERYHYAARATQQIIADINVATGLMTLNEAVSSVCQYEFSPGEDVELEWWFSRVHPEDLPRVRESFHAALNSGERWSLEYRFRRADGSYAYMTSHALVIRDPEGQALRVICASLDISERRQLGHQIEMVLTFAGDGIVAADLHGAPVLANPAAAAMFQCSAEELRATEDLHESFHRWRPDGSAFPIEECPIIQTAADGVARSGEDVFFTKNETVFPVEYSISPIIEDGQRTGVVMVFRDITARKHLEYQLEQANRVSSLGRVAATIAHEFNNVLMGIQPFAEVIQRNTAEEKLQEAAKQIINSVARGKRITSSVLRFTQPAEPAIQTVNLADWLQGLTAELRALVGQRIEVVVEPSRGPATCLCDPGQLQQVVTNLVLNARDAMPGGGRVSLCISDSSDPTEYPFGRVPDRMAMLSVADGGSGMSPEILRHILVPLFTTKSSGTGLGLAVVQQVISRHGGSIHVTSKPGKGTTFFILLPAASEQPRQSAEPASPPVTASRRRVLIVDDDQAVAFGIAALLESEGMEVRTLERGSEAVDSFKTFRPDVVLLDWNLPDMNGVEVFDRLRSCSSDLPVVFSTGHGDESSLQKRLKGSEVAFLRKPYELDTLLRALDAVTATASKKNGEPG